MSALVASSTCSNSGPASPGMTCQCTRAPPIIAQRRTPSVAARAYDEQIGTFSTDGTFNAKAVAALKTSFVDMGLLKEAPADDVMFTTQFVPVK